MSKKWVFFKEYENLSDEKIWVSIKHLGEPEVHDLFPEDVSEEWGEDIETNEGQGDD